MNLKLFGDSDERGGSGRVPIIRAVTTYLGFLVLLVLIVEAVLGVLVLKENGQTQLVALYGFLVIVVILIGVVSYFQYHDPGNLTSAAFQGLINFGSRIEGHWWEVMTPSTPTAISLFHIAVDPQTGTVRINNGTGYNQDGQFESTWESVATCINLGEGKLFYYWRGSHQSRPEESFEGFGEMSFDQSIEPYSRGRGIFFDSNLADVSERTKKFTRLIRCGSKEYEIIGGHDTAASEAFIKRKCVEHGIAS
jgi:hypothetical protein